MVSPCDSVQKSMGRSSSSNEAEPCIFPAFDIGETDGTSFLSVPGELPKQVLQDPTKFTRALCSAWGIVLGCYTGLEQVCFRLSDLVANEATTTARLSVPGHATVQNLRPEHLLDAVPSDESITPSLNTTPLSNTWLRVTACDPRTSSDNAGGVGDTANHEFPPWCKVCITVNAVTCQSTFSWMGSFMTREQALHVNSTFETIVCQILDRPLATISELNYISERSMRQILANNSNPKSHIQKCIHQAISEQGDLRPEAQAVCAWDGSLTYNELLSLANRLACRLESSGVGPEIFVPICFDKSKWTIVAMLAVLKAGGIFVPLDPTHPVRRLQALSRKINAKTILCSRHHLNMLEPVATELIPVDDRLFTELPAEHSAMTQASWSNGAYMIFTSGTTGEPKGALIQHGALLSSAMAHGPAMMMDANTRSLQFAASTFDVSITEILTCLILGGCVCVPSEEARLNDIEGAINDLKPNWALLTPTFVKFINPANVPSLQTLVTGGEAMTLDIIRSWSKSLTLVNCYGPAETSVVSHVNVGMKEGKDPLNIGRHVGIHCWVVDPHNHDRLMPIGAIGELLIEGHTLAREYYKEPEKTSNAFINNPEWTKCQPTQQSPRRMYKTGDLVRYNSDGTFHIAGRKDSQIKFHGQRIELGEIEHHLGVVPSFKWGMVMLPKAGFCKGRLLTMIQLSNALNQDLVPNGKPYELVNGDLGKTAKAMVEEAKEILTKRLPPYMIPSMWLPVEFIPRLPSGKLDRKQTTQWVENMSEDIYRRLNPVTSTGPSEDLAFASPTEAELHRVWAHVLNLNLEQLGFGQSFLSVGGDSISAMQVMSECKKRGLGLTVGHIIGCKSIVELASHVKGIEAPIFHEEMLEHPFELSPIQKLYFDRPHHSQGHYNQSFLLRTNRRVLASDLDKALDTVIQRHSMLRARFSQTSEGVWQQRITNETASSYRLRTLRLARRDEVDGSLVHSQTCLNPVDGPLLAADLIDLNGEEELLFVVAHHLVIDLVSWRVILQDLEELLLGQESAATAEKPLPFQTWCKMQLDHCQSMTPEQALPIPGIPDGNASYWDMETTPNVYGQMARGGFELDSSSTSLLLRECHRSLRTEIPDVLLAAMIFSFGQTFTDRAIPPVYAEGHGRESWDPSIDLSRVVGWFTTIYPVFAGSDTQTTLVDTAKLVKDARRSVPDSGRPYFASRWLTEEGKAAFSRHWPLEITFNYLGQYQQLEREGALFTPVRDIAGEVKEASDGADVGPLTTCISLFEVSAVIIQGALRFSFIFNQNMKHQEKIRDWISSCQKTLETLIETLSIKEPEPTLSDFPMLSLTYDRLQQLVSDRLPKAGVTALDLVEDAYPCSPMQSGLLMSTARDSAFYSAYTLHEVKRSNGPVDPDRLADAWETIVAAHPILRTIFVESVSQLDSLYDQVVLNKVDVPIIRREALTDEDAISALSEPPMHQEDTSQLLHRFEICTASSGKVFCRLDISHVIMDGTSMSIIFRDLALAYENGLKVSAIPPYRNYIKYLQNQAVQPGIDYWSSYLNAVEPCHFPVLTDGNTAKTKELRYVRVTFDKLAELQSLCDEKGVTFVNAIYAAWALTLRLYTASEEVCFGYLTSARDAPIDGIRDIVGPVINMVACRVNVTDSTTLGQIMAGVQADYLDSLAFRHIPLAEVQHALQSSAGALFNTALSYRKLPPSSGDQLEISFEECRPTYDPDEYHVSINIEAGDNDMAIDLMYWTNTLSDDHAANVASVFTQALSNILHHSNQQISELDHLSTRNQAQLSQLNSKMPEAIESCVHHLIEQQACRRPDAPAIASWDMNFTYSELDVASTNLAHHLSCQGVGLETFVLICFEKSAFPIVAMMAALKAGGVCVPLDPAHPDTALQLRANDTGASIALVSPSLVSRFRDIVPMTVAVNDELLQSINNVNNPTLPLVTPRNACFVIYTSGSTGKPKGVVLEHRGIATNAEYSGIALGYEEDSRVLQFASYTFDNSLSEIFTTLVRGGCVCVPSDHERLNDLAGVINRHQVTLVDITPTVATFLQPSDVPTLKTLALGGEAVTTKCVDIWRDHVSLKCCYGPSECSINSTYSGDIAQPGQATNIGRAVGSVAWVVDGNNHNSLVPVGCVGELLVDGPIVSRGYLNMVERTDQSFIRPPPWLGGLHPGGDPARRLYKTGDLVRYNCDGTLMYLGRKDTQVKLNGQRIELGEIEHHMELNLPEDTQSAVELVMVNGKKSLAGFVSTEWDGSVPASSDETNVLPMSDSFKRRAKYLEMQLSKVVPGYMIPTMWLPIFQMPLTTSGKLNRRSLRLQAQAVPEAQRITYRLTTKSGRAPSSDRERLLARLWASVLNTDVALIGVEDNFFKLGGDSVSAMRLVSLARRENMSLTVAGIFQKSTLLDMIQSATSMSMTTSAPAKPFSQLPNNQSPEVVIQEVAALARVAPQTIQDVLPCTAIQEGLMALSNKQPGAYVAQIEYRLPEGTDVDRFKDAWEQVVASEPILRTRVVYTEASGFLQVVMDDSIKWSSVSCLSDLQDTDRLLPVHNGGRLSHYTIAGEDTNAVSFVWTIHHALYDGWCMPIILDQVKKCYQGVPISQSVSGSSYANFIKYVGGLDSEQTDEFWKSKLSNLSTQHFPRLPQPGYQANASSMLIHKVAMSRQQGSEITLATEIRAAWALTVSAYSGVNDLVFWETVTGRDAPIPGIEDMVGPTLATIPRRMLLDQSYHVSEFLRLVQEECAAALPHQYTRIPHIQRLSADATLACGAQNLIAINQGSRDETDSFWDLQSNENEGTNFYTYPIMVSFHMGDNELEAVVHFDPVVISDSQMQRVLDHFAFTLQIIDSAQFGSEKLCELSTLSRSDCDTLQLWNKTLPPMVNSTVHEMIQSQVAIQGEDKVSICSWDFNLTYAQLDAMATLLASILRHRGVGPKSIIPLCLDKSAIVPVSMLGVLKSGAAFVPLDPAHPDARISGIIADVEATVILCSPKYEERCSKLGSVEVIAVSPELIENVDSVPEQEEVVSVSDPTSPAYLIFTSGTTGKPKGTILQHSAFCTGAMAHGTVMGMNASSRVLQFASYTFDASIMEVLTTLLKGGTVCIPSDEERINGIAGAINRMDVNWALLTPSVAQLIQPSSVPGLKTLVLGGEAMSSTHIATWSTPAVRLMNAYGPTETSVIAAINPDVTIAHRPSNIGRAVGGLCWVTDASDHDKLVPVGAVGELLVEGPILAQGYLNNPQRTIDSFVVDPRWVSQFPLPNSQEQRRMYKTGDLVKLAEDGSIVFQGRKDNQVKLNGQRLELSEVEHHLGTDLEVQHGLAAIPLSGPFQKRLVAVLSLKSLAEITPKVTAEELRVVGKQANSSALRGIQDRVAIRLPSYMVPSKWIILYHLPLLPSGKLDRRTIMEWVENMDEETCQLVSANEGAGVLDRDATVLETKLRHAWAKVLSLEVDKVPYNQSFFQLGGDSISAMQMMATCRSANISVSVQHIMQSRSIVELATHATAVEDFVCEQEEENTPFELTPIQKLYAGYMATGSTHFNQSLLLGTTRAIATGELSKALEGLIGSHGMLRSRFFMSDEGWSQRITDNVADSYRVQRHAAIDLSHLPTLVENSQKSLDIVNGPLLAVDIFETEDSNHQRIALMAHHLIVDVVSWNIILEDLESLLTHSTTSLSKPLSFQTWTRLQWEHAQSSTRQDVFHEIEKPCEDLSFWGMQDRPNLHCDAISESFDLNEHHSRLLLGPCHQSFQTDVVDVLLASLLGSFRQAFPTRPHAPAIFNEGHGREPWNEKLDLSRTIGWFTTLCPVFLPESLPDQHDILDLVHWIKDFRRRVPGKGRPYFAHSLLSSDNEEESPSRWPVEVAFNYLGNAQNIESKDSAFKSLDETISNSDIGPSVPRLALIEISASVVNGQLHFDFSFNRHMKHQAPIQEWVKYCMESIGQAVGKLCSANPSPTMDRFPQLPLAFRGVSQIREKLLQLGIDSLDKIEDAYPCSPVQQGILFAQIKNPDHYAYSIAFEVHSTQSGAATDAQRLADAWQAVVQHHSTLRTLFVPSLLQEGTMDQVVLKQHPADVQILECGDDELASKLSSQAALGLLDSHPPHRMRVYKTPQGKVVCALEMSHAISDGGSMPILFRDLALAYEGTLSAARLTVYKGYIAHFQGGPSSKALAFWENYLRDIEPCHFPTLNNGVTEPKTLRTVNQDITHSLELQSYCAENGITLSNVLQLAWALILQLYTGMDDVCFGYLVSSRDIPVHGIEDAIGVFINMLICRVHFNPNTSLRELLQSVQQDLMSGMEHKEVSLADIQHKTKAHNAALFNTAYSFQRRSVSKSMATGPLSFDVLNADDPNEYDMTVNVEVWDNSAELQLCYWSDKVSDSEAKNIASTFDQILSSLVASEPQSLIGELPLLSNHCENQISSWNHHQPDYLDQCVHHIFERNVTDRPASQAVDAWDARFTYAELDVLASQLAQILFSHGVKPESFVALCFEKSAWTVVAMMAVLKAGGAFVPLDPTHPPERISFLLQSVDAKLILCSSSLVEKLESYGIETFGVGDQLSSQQLHDSSANQLHAQVGPSNPAYIIFTSGTTGLPKGTIIEHGAFSTGAIAHSKAIKMTASSRVLQFASHTFDASIMEILSTLLVGGCVCIPSDQDRLNDLSNVINRFNINWTLLTPSVANVLKPGSVPSLKVLVTGGEAMSRDHIQKWAKEAALVNAYGPSETSVIAATSTKVDENGIVMDREPGTIGYGVGSRCWVVDPRNPNRLMPIGAIGELIVEGPIVARGYLNNETKTQEAFIEHPQWRVNMQLPGNRTDRMYKTGDLVTYNSDGSLKYGGRKDTQVKLNGQRVELGEIEHHVQVNLPATTQSAVDMVVPQSKTSAKALAAFIAIEKEDDDLVVTDIDEILLHVSEPFKALAETLKLNLQGVLPSYMLPTLYIPVAKMPWTLAGKLDRQRLRGIIQHLPMQQLAHYKLAGASKKRNPTTPMQYRLQKAWQQVLRLSANEISVDDSFFRLGGDSVGAMKLVSVARSERIALTVLDVFRYPKLSDMATTCTPLDIADGEMLKPFSLLRHVSSPVELIDELAGLCHVPKAQIQDVYPCSSLQEGLVTLTLDKPGAYVAEYVFKLPGNINLDRFKMAWQMTADHVEILRSRIVNSTSSRFYQVVLQPQPLDWNHASNLSSATGRASQIPGSNGGVLAQYTLVEDTDSGSRFFVWAVHHALYDAWSMPGMMNMVESYYLQENLATISPSVPFVNFIQYLANVDVDESNEYWKAKFSQGAPIHFPMISSVTAPAESSRATLRHTVPYSADCSGMGITIPTLVRAAWALVLGSQTDSDDVVFGETLSGRDIALDGISDILGPALTTIPSRVMIDRDATIADFLKTIHDQSAEVIPYQHAGLQNIKRLGAALADACNFSNLLVIQVAEERSSPSQVMNAVETADIDDFFTYPLVVECAIDAQSLVLTLHHDESVLTSWQMERIMYQFDALVQQLVSGYGVPARKVATLSLCSPQDMQIIKEKNDFPLEYADETIPGLFLSIAAQTPHATAIHAWDGEINYESVQEYATRLAKYMVNRGVKAETLVPCCMDKSIWTTISMMAVMLAGGVLVPLEPAHPPTRHVEIVGECQAPLVLCSVQHRERFLGLGMEVVAVNSALFNITLSYERDDDSPLPTVRSQDAAFVIYTSGSTGKPKGVIIEHGSFCTSAKAWMKHMDLTSSSRAFHFTSYAFDAAMGETLGVLAKGGCVCVPSEEMRSGDLSEAMNSLRATWAFLTPSVANIQNPSSFKTLQTLVCGGEPLTAETVNVWADKVSLKNGYGPAECTIFCMVNAEVSVDKDHTHVGYAMEGGHAWVVDPKDHNALAPLGCIGEILISGPIVSRGYLNNKSKTDESFIQNPSWAPAVQDGQPIRLYKTGDLGKYRSDGKMAIMGRKDLQVKLHGQRIELGEIEATLDVDSHIRHALVSLPKSGVCKGRLVAIISLHGLASTDPLVMSSDCITISPSQMETARTQVSSIQNRLSETLPPYMLPTSWFVVKDIPLLASGKLDRARVQSWIATMDLESYKNAVSLEASEDLSEPETSTGQLLRRIWSSVLHMPQETMPINQSLISLGGDSITAMQIMTLCRDHSIKLSLHEIIKGKSITELAEFIDTKNRHLHSSISGDEEEMDRPFSLSPVQQLYFNNSSDQDAGDHFNQSQLLLIKEHIEYQTFNAAIEALLTKHSMLRSRFTKSPSGEWSQLLSSDIAPSYRLRYHTISSESEMTLLVSSSQQNVDIRSGPLFIVDLFERPGKPQIVSLIAHHLVVDIVSWFIILRDLETFLTTSSRQISKPFSFQSWCAAQAAHAIQSDISTAERVLPFAIQPADFDFWGMGDVRNSYGDVTSQSFVLSDAESVALALDGCHSSMRTEPLDLFMSALLQSFGLTFGERQLPTVFNEGHGRESWDDSIDISQTVGWFTALSPVCVSLDDREDVIESIRKVKDIRRSVSDHGRKYFAHRYVTEGGKREFKDHEPMELLVNYLGRTHQSNQATSFFEQFDYAKTEEESKLISDVGPDTHRLALFEVSIVASSQGIEFNFLYNKQMRHQDRIAEWISSCKSVLVETANRISQLPDTPTLSDVPLLPVNYEELHQLVVKSLPAAQLTSFSEVEDIFPCSPIQVGILLSQLQDPGRYLFHTVLEIVPGPTESKVDVERLSQACTQVINRRTSLRTVFINSLYRSGTFDQVVVKPRKTRISLIQCREIEVMAKLNAISLEETNRLPGPQLPYQVTICQTRQGKIWMKLEMNHAITDGASSSIIMSDIQKAYNGKLPSAEPPSYKEYIKYISAQSSEANLAFWMGYLRGVQLTEYPIMARAPVMERTLNSVEVDFREFSRLHSLASSYDVTLSSIILVAWALVLHSSTKLDDLCFGYLTSGRDADIEGIDDIVGPLINMLVFRFRFEPNMSLRDLLHQAQEDYLASLPHQHFSLARVNNALGFAKRGLFNTAVSIQNAGPTDHSEAGTLGYEMIEAHDPSEYAVTVNVNTTREDEGILFRYWSDVLSTSQAEDLAETFAELLHDCIDHAEESISQLRVFQCMSTPTDGSARTPDTEDMWSSDGQDMGYMSIENLKTLSASKLTSNLEKLSFSGAKKLVHLTRLRELLSEKLSRVWRETLSLPEAEITHDDSFFELGGDSIVAMSMVGIAREVDMSLTVADIFQNATFGEMLECLLERSAEDYDPSSSGDETYYSKKDSRTGDSYHYEPLSLLEEDDAEQFVRDCICPIAGVSRASIVDVLPTTDFQRQALEGSLLDSRWMLNIFYLDGFGSLDVGLLRESITNIVASFDILRTVFVPYADQFLQVVLRQLQPDFRVVVDVEDIDQYTAELEQDHLREIPKLGESYVRFTVAQSKSSNHHRIFLRISHAQYDGVCFPTILQALRDCYEGKPISATPPYASYAHGALGKITSRHYAYWKKLLQGSAMTDIVQRERGTLVTRPTMVLKKEVSVRSLASLNITAATVIKAAWSQVLAQITGKSDVLFGHLISGRNVTDVPGIESIVGPCLNVVPVRVRLQTSWTVLELLRHIQGQQISNMAYESLGFREIIEKCADWGQERTDRNFSTMVQHQSMPQTGGLTMGANSYTVGAIASQQDPADFSVVTTPKDAERIEVCLIYANDGCISPTFAEKVFDALCKTIELFSLKPESPISVEQQTF